MVHLIYWLVGTACLLWFIHKHPCSYKMFLRFMLRIYTASENNTISLYGV